MTAIPEKCGISVSVLIPAFNEEKNLAGAVAGARLALARVKPADQEIIILNANSADATGSIADDIAAGDSRIQVIHRRERDGLGGNYLEGVRRATMDYFVMFPGDNENSWESLAECLELAGKADIIIPYTLNREVRAWYRRIISSAFVNLLNLLFGLQLRYYNGNVVYQTAQLRELAIHSRDFAYNAEILVKLIRTGHIYLEHGIRIRPTGKTSIFSMANAWGVFLTIFRLFVEVHVNHRDRYRKRQPPKQPEHAHG